jgi:hypothetical protein
LNFNFLHQFIYLLLKPDLKSSYTGQHRAESLAAQTPKHVVFEVMGWNQIAI